MAAGMEVESRLRINSLSLGDRVSDVDASFETGQFWHVLGQNGAGKSSFFDLISGLESASSGSVTYCGVLNEGDNFDAQDNLHLASTRTYLQQNYSLSFELTALELLQFYLEWPATAWNNLDATISKQTIPADLEHALHIASLLNKKVSQLSGGELQRLHIARILLQIWPSLVASKGFVLLDEPLQNLDVAFQASVLALLQHLAKRGTCVVMSVHDVNIPLQYATHVMMLKHGKVYSQGEVASQVDAQKLTELFDYPFDEFIDVTKSEKLFVKRPKAPAL